MRNTPDARPEVSQDDPGHHWVRGLRSDADAPEEPVCSAETIASAVAQVGADPVQWAVELGARIADRTIRRLPEFGGGRASVTTLRLGTEQVAIYMVRSLDAGHMVHTPNSAETSSMIHDYVHRRVPMDRIWAGMRYGHAWLTEEFMAACRTLVDRDQRAEELESVSQILFEQVITYAAELGELYRVENDAWVSSAEFARDDAIRSILEGEEIDENAISQTLRYPLSQFHVALVLKVAAEHESASADLHTVASELLQSLGTTTALVVGDSASEVRAWGGSDHTISADDAIPRKAIPGVDIAVGFGGRGANGFRRAAEEAVRTADIAGKLRYRPPSIVTYDQVSLVGLLLENPDQAANFADRELGKLAEKSPHVANLRETVLAYFECRHSPRAAGERLFVAKNTVIYRIKRAEELIGRSLDERPAETWAALLIAKSLYDCEPEASKH
ncbi:PucR family transcriptional regulator [Rhodococcus koreensis]